MTGSVERSGAAPTRATTRPFVGRAYELGELQAGLEDASSGRGRLLLVTGEPGIGKTRLMQELAGFALDQDWRVLMGRCWEEGGAPAYWPWIQVVRAAGGEFERLAGEAPGRASSAAVDPESARFTLFDAVTRFLADAARERPLLIVLDDLHAADAPSLLLLRFLGEAISQSPVLVLGSYREGESRVGELAALFAELVRVATRLSLDGLTVEEVEAYVTSVGGDVVSRSVAARLRAVTGGNPFFLGEVVRLRPAPGGFAGNGVEQVEDPLLRIPEEVRVLIRRRVADLSTETVSVLRTSAVIGREFDLRLLERTSHVELGRLLDVLAEAVDAGVLHAAPAPGRYLFAHELVREALYDDVPPSRRAELHLAIGRVLEEVNRSDLDPHLSEIAHHLARAAPVGDADEAAGYLVRAGDRACGVLAYEEAVLHYTRALQLLAAGEASSPEQRCELFLRLGDAHWRAGDTDAARSSFEDAVELARRLADGELLGRGALGYVSALGGFLLFARFEAGATGVGLLEEALAALPENDSALRGRLLAHLALEMCAGREQPVERRVAVSEQAIELARRLDDKEVLVTALHARHWALTAPELVHERLAHTDEMLRVAEETGNRELQFLAHNARFHCFLELCDGRAMDTEIGAMAHSAELIQQPSFLWHAACVRTVRAIVDGRFADAERLAGEALAIGRLRQSVYPAYVFAHAQTFAIRWAQGRLNELSDEIRLHGGRFPWVPRWRDALSAAQLGDVRSARAEVERHAGQDFADLPRDGLWTLHVCALAEACVLIGDVRRGALLYELLLPHADRQAVSYTQQPLGPVALRLGMLAGLLGRRDEAERHFEHALERCDLLGARAVRARVLYEHGRMVLGDADAKDGGRASALLDEAARLSEELDLQGLHDRVAALGASASGRRAPALFHREGEFWTISFGGKTCRLKDTKGLRYIAFLIGAPGNEVHSIELAQAVEGLEPRSERRRDAELVASQGGTEPVLDAPAKEAYRRRLHELGDDLREARDWHDPERVARIEDEIDALTDELAGAAGLGGRDRRPPSPAERARVSVTKAIRAAIRTIDRHDPALGAHLAAAIRTGRFCSYAPPGEEPPRWSL
jgi:eukaryotic-like serine/threonine-protein kinase